MKAKIDKKYLRNLLGSEESTTQFIALFKKESKKLTQDILLYWQEGDFKNLSIAAHGLKSHLRYVNAKDLADDAQKIEYECEKRKPNPEFENWIIRFTKEMKEML